MKNVLLLWVILLFSTAFEAFGQFSDKEFHNNWLVLNTTVIMDYDLERASGLMKDHFEKELDQAVKDGMLESWGYLPDGLMEDGNFNIYYVTKTQLDFDNFWGEYTRRNSENNPDAWSELISCFNSYKISGHTNALTHTPSPMR